MAKIYKFPGKGGIAYKIPLYSEIEVDVVLICLNTFSRQDVFATLDNLGTIDSKLVLSCLNEALESWIYSNDFKEYIKQILGNVEVKKS